MSKRIRPTTVVRRPRAERTRRPIYLIASGGEVFVARRLPGALIWVPATEADFGGERRVL